MHNNECTRYGWQWVGFYRDQLDLLRPNQVNISLLINITAI